MRERILEAATVGIALDHDLDERLVHHIHLVLAVAVGEGHFFAAHDSGTVGKVGGNGPVKGYVRERSLSTPTARCVNAVDKGFNALLDRFVVKVIIFYKGSKIGIK